MALICPACGTENRSVAKFCIECIAPLPADFAATMVVPPGSGETGQSYEGLPTVLAAFVASRPDTGGGPLPPSPSGRVTDPLAPPMPERRSGLWVSVAAFAIAMVIGAAGWLVAGAGGWYIYSSAGTNDTQQEHDPASPTHAVKSVAAALPAAIAAPIATAVAAAVPAANAADVPMDSATPAQPAASPAPAMAVAMAPAALATESAVAAGAGATATPGAAKAADSATSAEPRPSAAPRKTVAKADPERKEKVPRGTPRAHEASTERAQSMAAAGTGATRGSGAANAPSGICGDLGFFAVSRCMVQQCDKPQFSRHAECSAVHAQQRLMEEKRNPQMAD